MAGSSPRRPGLLILSNAPERATVTLEEVNGREGELLQEARQAIAASERWGEAEVSKYFFGQMWRRYGVLVLIAIAEYVKLKPMAGGTPARPRAWIKLRARELYLRPELLDG